MPTALVTGATSGIGAAFARHLARSGYALVLVARDAARLSQTAATLRDSGSADIFELPADLTDPAQRARVVERLADTDRPIELLINNAGLGLGRDFLISTEEELQYQLELNVTAVTVLARAVLPGMVDRGVGGVINVASIAGLVAGRGSTYSASKAFVVSLSEGLAASYGPEGVRVQALCPGFVRTEFHRRAGIDMAKTPAAFYVDIDQVVRTSLADLRAHRPLAVPGALYKSIALLTRLLPRGVVRKAAARVSNAGRT